jgi:tRNA threonylcarbamoyladenosine biosynthesis protein TsaE
MKKIFSIHSLDDWNALAQQIAPDLVSGSILALSGPLGAGKTTFVQALAKALGSKDKPKSPTFALMRIYRLKHPTLKRLVHVDAYRIENEQDLLVLNLDEELTEPGTMLAIEWPEHITRWLRKKKTLRLSIKLERGQRITRLEQD